MVFNVSVIAYDETGTQPTAAQQLVGVIPRALLRPQGVGELKVAEVSLWCNNLISELQTQGRNGSSLTTFVFGTIQQISINLQSDAQTHAFGRFICSLLDGMCVCDPLGVRQLSHAQQLRVFVKPGAERIAQQEPPSMTCE